MMQQNQAWPAAAAILSGWKEIANYLHRGVRTVQRWEKFGLPVRRPAAHLHTAVIASSKDLDAWLLQTQTRSQDFWGALQARVRTLETENAELQREIMRLRSAPAKARHEKKARTQAA
jgi:cell division protein FtsB